MKKLLFLACFFGLFGSDIYSQATDTTVVPKAWTLGGFVSLNLNQVSFVDWAAGGENTFSANALGSFSAKYKKNKSVWENNADASYGILWSKQFKWRKSEDKWEVQSKYGYAITKNEKLFASVLANFKSQFANGYNYPDDSTVVSRALSPGMLLLAAGIDYKPVDYFSLFVSPLTGKLTFVHDQDIANLGTYGNEPAVYSAPDSLGNKVLITEGEKVKKEFGAYLNAKFQKDIFKNVNLLTKLDLFYDYLAESENRKYVDVNWETTITMKVNKYLAASLILQLIYDHDINIPDPSDTDPARTKKGVQFKEVLGVGLSYKFNEK